jgi:hypothetical protein
MKTRPSIYQLCSITMAVMLIVFTLGCSSGSNDIFDEEENSSNTQTNPSGNSGSVSFNLNDLSSYTIAVDSTTSLSETDNVVTDNEDYVENATFNSKVYVHYNGGEAAVTGSVDGVTATVSGADVTINSTVAGVDYVLSGTTTDGSLKIYSKKKYRLDLNGVNIKNADGPAINDQSGKRVYVVLNAGTTNTLTDGTSYTKSDENQKGTLFAEGKLIFSGTGKLRVYANTKAGISSDDYIIVRPGTNIYVKSTAGNGIKANDAITILGGIVNIETTATASKGISSDGTVAISGGRTTIITSGGGDYDSDEKDVSACAGVKADSTMTVSGGELYCLSKGNGGKGISTDQDLTISGGTVKVICEGDTYQYGNYDTKPKAIKSDGAVTISGGTIWFRSIKSDGAEGIESKSTMTISGGEIKGYTYDDCINSSKDMTISGGTIEVFAFGNDGIDSNGNLYIKGGTITAYGTSSPEEGIDVNSEGGYKMYITGGTVIGVGGGASTPSSTTGSQPTMIYSGNISQGTTVSLNDGSSNTVLSFVMVGSYNSCTILVSSPNLSSGTSYSLYGGSNLLSSFTATVPYSSSGNAGGNMGGGPGGGRPGGR